MQAIQQEATDLVKASSDAAKLAGLLEGQRQAPVDSTYAQNGAVLCLPACQAKYSQNHAAYIGALKANSELKGVCLSKK